MHLLQPLQLFGWTVSWARIPLAKANQSSLLQRAFVLALGRDWLCAGRLRHSWRQSMMKSTSPVLLRVFRRNADGGVWVCEWNHDPFQVQIQARQHRNWATLLCGNRGEYEWERTRATLGNYSHQDHRREMRGRESGSNFCPGIGQC